MNHLKKLCVVLLLLMGAMTVHATEPPKEIRLGYRRLVIGDNNELVLTTDAGIYRSVDGGDNWLRLHVGGYPTVFTKGKELFVVLVPAPGWTAGWIMKSRDFGLNWEDVGQPAKVPWAREMEDRSGMTSLVDGNFYVCVDRKFLQATFDAGKTWQELTVINGCNGISATKKSIYVLGDDALYRSDDQGKHWTVLGSKESASQSAIKFGLPSILTKHPDGSLYLQGYVSYDEGQTWERNSFGFPADWKFVVEEIKFGVIFLDVTNNVNHTLPELLFSLDGKTAKTHDFDGMMRDVEVDKSGAIYVVTFRDIFKSTDQGTSWKPLGKKGICMELGGCGQ